MDTCKIAVFYLARGADNGSRQKFERFIASYQQCPAGEDHDLFIIFKGFADALELSHAKTIFSKITYKFIYVQDSGYDIGSYRTALMEIQNKLICCFNTNSEIQSSLWLKKLWLNLNRRGVGVVSATGSYESLSMLGRNFPTFPNIHIRSNAFLIPRDTFLKVVGNASFSTKKDAWLIESGAFGFTRYVFSLGLDAQIVGKDGRGYSPSWWASSETFKLRNQNNLMVQDNVTRGFEAMIWSDKVIACRNAWGDSLNNPGSIV